MINVKKIKRLIKDITIIKRSGKLPGHTGLHGATPDKR
jgi:hypothetical protein|tara:strand:+ start:228 stop:341 length:114 start_codon:yes stop_codon:yes gene_type:complete